MRRLFLLAGLCLVASLVLAPAAMAQDAPGPADGVCEGAGEGDPDCAAALLDAVESGEGGFTGAQYAEATEAPVTGCSQFTTLTGEFSQFQAQQFFDFLASPEDRELLDPDGNGFACDNGTIEFGGGEPAPTATETYSALPDTGGFSLAALGAGALLIAGGLLIRRR